MRTEGGNTGVGFNQELGSAHRAVAALNIPVPHDKAERRVLEEELTVHLSVPGDTILINNRPGPREPPPYQEPRPRGNPPHSAPGVPNGSGKTFLVPVPPPSSACLLSVSFFLSFTIPFFYCLPQFQLIFLFLCPCSQPSILLHVLTI